MFRDMNVDRQRIVSYFSMEVALELERNGESRILKTTLTEAFAKGISLQSVAEPTPKQLALRNAWLKG